MLQTIRNKSQGIFTWIVVGLIALAFALFGVGDFFVAPSSELLAAKVYGKKITWKMVEHQYKTMFGKNVDQLEQNADNVHALKNQARDVLVRKMAILGDLALQGFNISDVDVVNQIQQFPQFQEKGQFSSKRYMQLLPSYGMTDLQFREEIRQHLLLTQLRQGIVATTFSLPKEVDKIISLIEQKRDFGYVQIPVKKDIDNSNTKLSEDVIKTYYTKNKTDFIAPERVRLDYILLSLSALKSKIEISKTQLQKYYQSHKNDFRTKESIHPRHILLKLHKNADKAIKIKCQKRIDNLYEQLKQGADFSTLAKAHSEDTGSAKNGGTLGWFEKGQTVIEFEKQAFALKKQEISKPVETQYGFHIIQLLDHRLSKQKIFEEVEKQIEKQLQEEQAETIFSEKAEQLETLAFEHPESLLVASQETGLPIQQTAFFSNKTSGIGITKTRLILNAAFSEEVLEKRNNSDLIKMNETTYVVLRVKDHLLSQQQPLNTVKSKIVILLKQQQEKEKAKNIADTMYKAIYAGEKIEQLTKAQNLDWIIKGAVLRNDKNIEPEVLKSAFSMLKPTTTKTPVWAQLTLENDNQVILAVSKVVSGKLDRENDRFSEYKAAVSKLHGHMEYVLYSNVLIQGKEVNLLDG